MTVATSDLEILFSNLNQAPGDIFFQSLGTLGDEVQTIGYDGIELTTVYSRALAEVFSGNAGADSIRSLHEGFPFAWPLVSHAGHLALHAAWSGVMPPSTIGRWQPGARLLESLRGRGLDVPVVAYPHWRHGAADLDRRKVARLGGNDVAIQPAADIFELWDTGTAADFLGEVADRHFKICFDTFHARRRSRLTGLLGRTWETWLPEAIENSLVTRVHMSAYREDFQRADPWMVNRSDAEMDALLYDDELTGELEAIVSCLKTAKPHQIKAVVVEIPRGGAVRSLKRKGYEASPNNISDLYQEAQEVARELFSRN